MRGLSFLSDGELFTVDVELVEKIVRNMAYTPLPAVHDTVAGIANMKGGIVTLLSLNRLLGRERSEAASHAVIFKPSKNHLDQMGLLIDKPGSLIEINEDEILPPPLPAEEKHSCISGMAEAGGKLYRIIHVDSIINRFNDGGDIISQGDIKDEN